MASEEAKRIAEKLNGESSEGETNPLYGLMVEVLVNRAAEIYDEYEGSESNPLAEYGDSQGFLEQLESKKDVIFAKLQNEVRTLFSLASKKKLAAEHVDRFLADLRRETWNFIYENYAKPK